MGVSFEALAAACFELGRRCGASAMVFAMHQIQVARIVRHSEGSKWFEEYLARLAREQRLIASATSEVGTGGDMGRSVAAVDAGRRRPRDFEKRLRRSATASTPTTLHHGAPLARTPRPATRSSC